MKPFSLIPGPSSFPLVGTLPYYLHKYKFDTLHRNGFKKYKEFGPIVREDIVPGTSIVWLFKPEDIKKMFEAEGEYPSRRSHLALAHYRLSKPHVYGNPGLLPTNGTEWSRIRSSFQTRPYVVKELIPSLSDIARDFVTMLQEKCRTRTNEIDMMPELKKYFVEVTILFLFRIRLGAIRLELDKDSEALNLQKAAMMTNDNILKTDNGLQLWRRFETPAYRHLRQGQEYIEKCTARFLNEHTIKLPFKSSQIEQKDVFTFVSDILLAGIDTSANTTGFLLYHLAGSKREHQEKLRGTCKRELLDDLNHFKYGKMALKEALRLNPISVGIGRISAKDVEMSGYQVPKGTVLVSQNQVSCRLPEFLDDPLTFCPERWLLAKDRWPHPYLSIPFGHGKRMCIGRRLAETSISVLVNHLIANFEFDWKGSTNLDCVSKLINHPNQPLVFALRNL